MDQTILTKSHSKKDRVLVIFVILLAILSLGLAGYIAYDKCFAPQLTAKQPEDKSDADPDESVSTDQNSGTSDSSSDSDRSNYIYIAEWGIKIEKPSDYYITYLYDAVATDGVIDFWAAPKTRQDTSIGGYEIPSQNISSLGILSRMDATKYSDCLANPSAYNDICMYSGGKVAEINGYAYLYSSPQAVWSTDSDEIEEEASAVRAIREMLESGITAL